MFLIKNNKTINIILNSIIVLLLGLAITFSGLYANANLPTNKGSISVRELGVNNASLEEPVDLSLLYGTFSNEKYFLTLSEDNTYILGKTINVTSPCSFSGKYEYKTGQDILSVITKDDIYKSGLNPEKINLDNLFLVKADYNKHGLRNDIEYYLNKNDSTNSSFYFLIYYKRSGDNLYKSLHPLTNLNSINFEKPFFKGAE